MRSLKENGWTISVSADADQIEISQYKSSKVDKFAEFHAVFIDVKNAEKIADMILKCVPTTT